MLYLDHVEILSLDYTPRYLGDLFHYNTEKRISVKGKVLNLSNSSGISGIWSGMANIIHNQDYDEIILNGQSFGYGKISDTVFEEGVDVREKSYTTNITVFESGNLFNLQSGLYSGITLSNPTFLEDLSESLSYVKGEDGGSTYQHRIDVTYRSGFNVGSNQRTLAQTLASGLFTANNFTGLLGLYNYNHIKKYNESYNTISNECSFALNYNFFRESGNYSVNYNHTAELNENGIINVTEQGNIFNIIGTSINGTYSQLDSEIAQSYSRCKTVATGYFGSAPDTLAITPIERAATINTFSNSIDYSVIYTNDPTIQDRYSWQYTTTLTKAQDGITNLTEQGSIIGFGQLNIDKFTNANRGYEIVKPNINDRLQAYYNKVLPNFDEIRPVTKTQSFNKFNGIIEYTFNYSDDLTLTRGNIRKVEVNEEITYPVHLNNNFNILNFKEITQPTENATVGVKTTTVTLWGNRDLSFSSFLGKAKSNISRPGGTDVFLAAANYSFDPFTCQFILTVTHHFHGSKAFTSNTVNLND